MSQELLYTSAPRGLKPGSRGFCTVLNTQGMATPLIAALEGLSGYRPIYSTGDDHADRNPVVFSHLKLQTSGRGVHVLSRIADFGLDYSERANKLAHHVVLDPTDLHPGGPASLLSMRGFMRDDWSGEPTVVPPKSVPRESDEPIGVCRAWQAITGDAGWAGVLAESFLQSPERLVILLFTPGQEILPLFTEALHLLPPERRWQVTFSTYFTGLATGTTCTWRAIVHDTKDAKESLRFTNALRLDLTSRSLGRATGGSLVQAARSGARTHRSADQAAHGDSSGVVFADADDDQVTFASDDPTFARHLRQSSRPQTAKSLPLPSTTIPSANRDETYPVASAPRPYRRLTEIIETETDPPRSNMGLWIGGGILAIAFIAFYFIVLKPGQPNRNDPGHVAATRPLPGPTDGPKEQAAHRQVDAGTREPVQVAASNHQNPATAPPPSLPEAPNENSATAVPSPIPGPTTTKPHDQDSLNAKAAGNTTPTVTQPAVPPKIEVKLITLPKQQPYVTLTSFDSPPQPPLGIALMKPSWLPYVDDKPRRRSAAEVIRLIVDKSDDAGEPFAIASIVSYANDRKYECRLKPLHDHHVPWLGWYRVQIQSGVPEKARVEHMAFSPFPLGSDGSAVVKTFKNYELNWQLPASALIVSPTKAQPKPQLVLERLVLRIGTHAIPLEVGNREPREKWTCSLKDHAQATTKEILGDAGSASTELELEMELTSEKNSPEIRMQLTKVRMFLKKIQDGLANQLPYAKTEIKKDFQLVYSTSLQDFQEAIEKAAKGELYKSDPKVTVIDSLLQKCKVDKADIPLDIQKELKDAISEAGTRQKAEGDSGRKEALRAAAQRLSKHLQLFESIVKSTKVIESFNDVSVVSARLSYELTGTMIDVQTGKPVLTDGKPAPMMKEIVDVVNFDDTAGSKSKTNGEGTP